MEVYRDNFIQCERYEFDDMDDIFESILEKRQTNTDAKRFFLEYLPRNEFLKYDFNDLSSIKKFRSACLSVDRPLLSMGGYNMDPNQLQDDIRYVGVKMSDPYGKIYGSFDIRNGLITYSPIFPHFYEERDLSKFAIDKYFTPMSFEDIMTQQIGLASSFYVHIGDYRSIKDIVKNGKYILERVNKNDMLEFATNPEAGAKIYAKSLKY